MALRWNFEKDFLGTVYWFDGDVEYRCNIYNGNALAIVCAENSEKKYTLHWFLCDFEHLKKILRDNMDCFSEMSFEFFMGQSKPKDREIRRLVCHLMGYCQSIQIRQHSIPMKWIYDENSESFGCSMQELDGNWTKPSFKKEGK